MALRAGGSCHVEPEKVRSGLEMISRVGDTITQRLCRFRVKSESNAGPASKSWLIMKRFTNSRLLYFYPSVADDIISYIFLDQLAMMEAIICPGATLKW